MDKYQKEALSNNLRLLTIPMGGVNSVTVAVFVGAGSRYEEKKAIGLAHFCEHMLFKGTKKRPQAQAISAEIDGTGGEFNGATNKDSTVFYVKCASKHLELAFDVLSDMLFSSLFDSQEVEREKGVIVEEINMYEDTPRERVTDILEELLFPNHPLGWFTGGKKETIKNFKRDDFLDYLSSLYSPTNIVLTVAGNFDPKKTRTCAQKYFGQQKKFKIKKFIPADTLLSKEKVKLVFKKTEQAHLALGTRSYPLDHPKRFALEVLNTILGQGMSSRLFINVRVRQGLAYYVGSYARGYQDTGVLFCYAGCDIKKIDKALGVIVGELKKLTKGDVPKKELQKAKEYIKGRLILGFEDSRGVAGFFGHQEVLLGKIETPVQVIEKIDKVKGEEVRKVAQELFSPENFRLAIIGPFKNAKKFRSSLGN